MSFRSVELTYFKVASTSSHSEIITNIQLFLFLLYMETFFKLRKMIFFNNVVHTKTFLYCRTLPNFQND